MYARISSRAQERRGDGLSSQEAICRRYAEAVGYEVVEVFREVLTGKDSDRPAMKSFIAYLRRHKSEGRHVIVDDVSRFARGHDAHWPLRHELRKVGGYLCSPKMTFGETANERLVEGMMVSVAAHQRELNTEQTKTRMAGRLLNGYWPFAAPVGYRHMRTPGHAGLLLRRDEPIASIAQEALEGFASGRFQTQGEVKAFFEAQPAFPNSGPHGHVRWQQVSDILNKLLYAGYVEHAPWGITIRQGKHEPLINLATFERIQERLHGRAKAPARVDINADFPLRGAVCCAECNRPMTACWSKSHTGAKHPYYMCISKECIRYRKSIRRDQIEGAFSKLLSQLVPSQRLIELAHAMFKSAWQQKTAQRLELAKSYDLEAAKCAKESRRVVDLIVRASCDEVREAYEQRLLELKRNQAATEERRAKLDKKPKAFEELFELAVSFLSRPYNLWHSGNFGLQRLVLRLTFAEQLA